MKFLYGFIGTVLGLIVGGVATFLIVTLFMDGNALGVGLMMLTIGPAGLILGAILGTVIALQVLRWIRKNGADRQTKRRNALVIGAFVLAVPVIAGAMLWSANHYGEMPSDHQLINNFHRNVTTFNELALMAEADKGLTRVDDNWTDPSDPQTIGISQARIARYRQLLNAVGTHRGFETGGKGQEVDFLYCTQGSATSSDTSKGYAYLPVPPKQTLRSLDHCSLNEKNGVKAYRHIQGCWYLFYEYLPG